jgi:REP element-mobilizing transposase RayT
MPHEFPPHHLDASHTIWHITFGTYGTRLHGGSRPSVDKQHNQLEEPFVPPSIEREDSARGRMKFPPRFLTLEQRQFVESELPSICQRGGWIDRVCSAAPDHVHLLCDIVPEVHGEKVRRLVKRWLGQLLSERWPLPDGATWWAEEGSNIAIHDEPYLNNAFGYIARQRTIPWKP